MKRACVCTGKALVLLLVLLQAGCGDLFMDEQKMLQLARDYLQAGKINAAAIELRNTLQENPGNAGARYLLATIYLDFGDYASAEKEFRNAREHGLDSAEVATGLARSRLGMGDYQGIVGDSAWRESWPAAARAGLLGLRALAHAALGNRDAARADLEAARELDAGSADVLRTGIQLQILAGDLAAAAGELHAALQRYPDDAGLLLLQAGTAVEDDRPAAIAAYRKIINMDPQGFVSANGRIARLQLAQLLILERDFGQAETLLRPLFRRDRNDPFTNYLGGVLAFQQGDYQKAEELLLKVLKLAPEHNPTRLLFGVVNYAVKNYEQAAYFLSKYIDAVPDNLVARKLLARSYILLGRNDEAAEVLQAASGSETNDAELLALAGLSELHSGRTAAGIAGLERAVRIEPDSAILRGELARAYIEVGETGLAITELEGLLAAGGEQRQTETLLVMAHLRAGEYSQAIDRVLDFVARNPDDPDVLALAGTVFAASGDLREARGYFVRARALQPGFPPATLALANIEEREGRPEQAQALYLELVEGGTRSALPMLALARIAEQQGDSDALLDWLERARNHAPDDLKPRIYLAEYHLRSGDLDRAGSIVKQALETAPEEPALLALSGRILMAGRDYRAALQPLQTLARTDPASDTAHVLLGESYLQLGRFDDARRELTGVLERNADNVQAMALLVSLELGAGAFDRALDYSRRLQRAYPELYLGYELAGDSLMSAGRFDVAGDEYARAWERLPSATLVIKRAGNAGRSGKPEVAIAWLRDWLQSHPGDVQVMQFLATTLQNSGKPEEAATLYEKVIAADPDNAVALNNLAGLYLADDRPEALGLAERAWQAAQDNPGIQDTYGWALVRDGQYGRGLRLLQQAVKSLPDIAEVRYHHAVALYRAGDKAEARQRLAALLKTGADFEGREQAERLLRE